MAKRFAGRFVSNPNARCACKSRVNRSTADELVHSGEAFYLSSRDAAGQNLPNFSQLVVVKRNLPVAKMLSARDIERAVLDGNRFQQSRIAEFGRFRLRAGEPPKSDFDMSHQGATIVQIG